MIKRNAQECQLESEIAEAGRGRRGQSLKAKDSAGLLSDLFPDRLQLVFENRGEGEEPFLKFHNRSLGSGRRS
jgi:hypothetical protein